MKKSLSGVLALLLLSAASSSMAWWNDNDHGPWGGGGNWNPYDDWDPRYWMEEMENEWDVVDVY